MPLSIDVSGISERDLDLLLLEEFASTPDFLAWFMGQIGMPVSGPLTAVARSVTTSTGESDLELTFDTARPVVKLLIENKLDAPLQPQQAERYRERAAKYRSDGECTVAASVIIAPDDYFPNSTDTLGFDHRLTYETLLDWFTQAPNLGSRRQWKATILESAIDRGRRGWQRVPDPVTTRFWQRYWEVARSAAPELEMPRPTDKPATSWFIQFRPVALLAGVELLHKVPYGKVDLQFAGMGGRLAELERQFGPHLASGMSIDRAGKSGVVRVLVPVADVQAPFSESAQAVNVALGAAVRLLSLYKRATEQGAA